MFDSETVDLDVDKISDSYLLPIENGGPSNWVRFLVCVWGGGTPGISFNLVFCSKDSSRIRFEIRWPDNSPVIKLPLLDTASRLAANGRLQADRLPRNFLFVGITSKAGHFINFPQWKYPTSSAAGVIQHWKSVSRVVFSPGLQSCYISSQPHVEG